MIDRHLSMAVDVAGLTPRTRRDREGVLRRLAWWLETTHDSTLEEATAEQLAGWSEAILRTSSGATASIATRRAYISHVREFYLWRALEGHPNPALRLRPPKKRRRLPRAMDERSLVTALAGLRGVHRVWLALAAVAGLRVGEIAAMRGEDIDDHEDPVALIVHGKGDRDRRVPLAPELWRWLQPYVVRGSLWSRPRGGQVDGDWVSHELSAALAALNLRYTAHHARHRFGRSFYLATGDLRATQEILGHGSVTSTELYTEGARTAAAVGVQQVSTPLRRITPTRVDRSPRSA
ncbi:site-specific integrase [Actinokineospora sp. UTMC 2448]|uniref:tyrosine-type recombinase/integrase n=1 Tax=Actinokineospora sp. UTMC 2448 TaxID=2268449 RepID=UPI00216415F0|nr:site-specific integrase [Actinokineospora sp. UTMC 2448]UVS81866.1 Tyrosine recombinase XerC [Actinokineospora sp. UTMC 2448]